MTSADNVFLALLQHFNHARWILFCTFIPNNYANYSKWGTNLPFRCFKNIKYFTSFARAFYGWPNVLLNTSQPTNEMVSTTTKLVWILKVGNSKLHVLFSLTLADLSDTGPVWTTLSRDQDFVVVRTLYYHGRTPAALWIILWNHNPLTWKTKASLVL